MSNNLLQNFNPPQKLSQAMLNRKITVGQSSRADVRLAHVGISRLHLELAPSSTPGLYIVSDLGSTNGTFIITPDRREIKVKNPVTVDKSTTLMLGNYKITVGAIISKCPSLPPIPGAAIPPAGGIRRDPLTGEIIIG